ncbi:hypothetical protein APS67_000687 [Streptomyces sp. AVP053U2]|nr:hypothetical protein APS67_000687 [Streptomyces sp. AVP053U2]
MHEQAGGRPAGRPYTRFLVPAGVNLLFGVPAMIPLHSAWLLLTRYRSCALDTAGFGLTHCGDVTVIEGAGWARAGCWWSAGSGCCWSSLWTCCSPPPRGVHGGAGSPPWTPRVGAGSAA